MSEDQWVDLPNDPHGENDWVDIQDHPEQESLGRRLTRSTLDTVLPVGGAIGAGMLATPETLGFGTVPAAAAGYAGGKQLSRLLKNYFLGDEFEANDLPGVAKQTVNDLAEGTAAEMGGQAVNKALEIGAQAAKPYVEPIANKVSQGFDAVGDYMAKRAEINAAKSYGANANQLRDIPAARKMGRVGLDEGIVSPNPFNNSAESMLERAEASKSEAGQAMQNIFGQVDQGVGPSVNPLDTAVKVENQLAPEFRTQINKGEWGQLENTLDSVLARGDENISLVDAQALKKEIDTVAFPKGKRPLDPTPKQQMAADASRIIRQQIDEAAQKGAERIGSKDLLKQLSDARYKYGGSDAATDVLWNKVGREEAGTGAKINWTMDPLRFGSSVVKKFSPNTQAIKSVGMDKISQMLKATPEAFGKFAGVLQQAEARGPQGLAATHFILQSQNPEYRQMIMRAAGDPNEGI